MLSEDSLKSHVSSIVADLGVVTYAYIMGALEQDAARGIWREITPSCLDRLSGRYVSSRGVLISLVRVQIAVGAWFGHKIPSLNFTALTQML
jgi:hypothetical protein